MPFQHPQILLRVEFLIRWYEYGWAPLYVPEPLELDFRIFVTFMTFFALFSLFYPGSLPFRHRLVELAYPGRL